MVAGYGRGSQTALPVDVRGMGPVHKRSTKGGAVPDAWSSGALTSGALPVGGRWQLMPYHWVLTLARGVPRPK